MTTLLWIVGYLVVGFVVAVLVERVFGDWPSDDAPEACVAFWPMVVCILLLLGVVWVAATFQDRRWKLRPLIRWCARRLP